MFSISVKAYNRCQIWMPSRASRNGSLCVRECIGKTAASSCFEVPEGPSQPQPHNTGGMSDHYVPVLHNALLQDSRSHFTTVQHRSTCASAGSSLARQWQSFDEYMLAKFPDRALPPQTYHRSPREYAFTHHVRPGTECTDALNSTYHSTPPRGAISARSNTPGTRVIEV